MNNTIDETGKDPAQPTATETAGAVVSFGARASLPESVSADMEAILARIGEIKPNVADENMRDLLIYAQCGLFVALGISRLGRPCGDPTVELKRYFMPLLPEWSPDEVEEYYRNQCASAPGQPFAEPATPTTGWNIIPFRRMAGRALGVFAELERIVYLLGDLKPKIRDANMRLLLDATDCGLTIVVRKGKAGLPCGDIVDELFSDSRPSYAEIEGEVNKIAAYMEASQSGHANEEESRHE